MLQEVCKADVGRNPNSPPTPFGEPAATATRKYDAKIKKNDLKFLRFLHSKSFLACQKNTRQVDR